MSEALTDFLEHLEVEGGRSQKTIINLSTISWRDSLILPAIYDVEENYIRTNTPVSPLVKPL